MGSEILWQSHSLQEADEMGAINEAALDEDDVVRSMFGVVNGLAATYAASKAGE